MQTNIPLVFNHPNLTTEPVIDEKFNKLNFQEPVDPMTLPEKEEEIDWHVSPRSFMDVFSTSRQRNQMDTPVELLGQRQGLQELADRGPKLSIQELKNKYPGYNWNNEYNDNQAQFVMGLHDEREELDRVIENNVNSFGSFMGNLAGAASAYITDLPSVVIGAGVGAAAAAVGAAAGLGAVGTTALTAASEFVANLGLEIAPHEAHEIAMQEYTIGEMLGNATLGTILGTALPLGARGFGTIMDRIKVAKNMKGDSGAIIVKHGPTAIRDAETVIRLADKSGADPQEALGFLADAYQRSASIDEGFTQAINKTFGDDAVNIMTDVDDLLDFKAKMMSLQEEGSITIKDIEALESNLKEVGWDRWNIFSDNPEKILTDSDKAGLINILKKKELPKADVPKLEEPEITNKKATKNQQMMKEVEESEQRFYKAAEEGFVDEKVVNQYEGFVKQFNEAEEEIKYTELAELCISKVG